MKNPRPISLAFLLAILLGGCNSEKKQEAIAAIQAEKEQLTAELLALEKERKRLKDERSEKKRLVSSANLGEKIEEAEAELKEALEYIPLLEEAESKLESQVALWREPVRKSLDGKRVERIGNLSGTVYEEVVITSFSGDAITFTHKGGEATEKMEDLIGDSRRLLLDEKAIEERVPEY